jgi:uncharacterized protein (DUF58 family)
VLTRFPFNLFTKGLILPLESEVVVYPPIKPLPSVLHADMMALGHDHLTQKRGQGSDLYNLRPYSPGDDSRSIHWRTTARTNLLIVRETEAEDQRRAALLLPTVLPEHSRLDQQPPSDKDEDFERAVELTASLATHLHEHGFTLRAEIGDQEIPEGVGQEHVYTILRALALCQPTSGPPSDATPSTAPGLTGSPSSGEELTVLVLPWSAPALESRYAGATRVIRASEFREFA